MGGGDDSGRAGGEEMAGLQQCMVCSTVSD